KLWREEETYKVLRSWTAEGCKASPAKEPAFTRLEILPKTRILNDEARNQQLVVIAHFADGSSRDVTPLITFSSSDEQAASVSKSGLVTFHKRGGVAILCRFLSVVDNARLSYLVKAPGFVWNNPPEKNYVDKYVFGKLRQLRILPAELCADDEFLRRLHLDVA